MKVHIEVDREELSRYDRYVIVKQDIELRDFLTGSASIGELCSYDIDEIISCAKRAISKGWDWGIVLDIESGRSPVTDQRTYDLHSVKVCEADGADYTVTEMINYIAKCELEYEKAKGGLHA